VNKSVTSNITELDHKVEVNHQHLLEVQKLLLQDSDDDDVGEDNKYNDVFDNL
jgi:hypothetical protein